MKIRSLEELQNFAHDTDCAECRRDAEIVLRILQQRRMLMGPGFEFNCLHAKKARQGGAEIGMIITERPIFIQFSTSEVMTLVDIIAWYMRQNPAECPQEFIDVARDVTTTPGQLLTKLMMLPRRKAPRRPERSSA